MEAEASALGASWAWCPGPVPTGCVKLASLVTLKLPFSHL